MQNGTESFTWWENGACHGSDCPPPPPPPTAPPPPYIPPFFYTGCENVPNQILTDKVTSSFKEINPGEYIGIMSCSENYGYFCSISGALYYTCSSDPPPPDCTDSGLDPTTAQCVDPSKQPIVCLRDPVQRISALVCL